MKTTFKIYTILLFLSMSAVAFAQEPEFGDEDDTNPLDIPGAPISDYLWVLALIGLAYVFYKMRHRVQSAK